MHPADLEEAEYREPMSGFQPPTYDEAIVAPYAPFLEDQPLDMNPGPSGICPPFYSDQNPTGNAYPSSTAILDLPPVVAQTNNVPGNHMSRGQRRISVASNNTIYAGDRTTEALIYDAVEICAVGALAKGNRLSETFNHLRKANLGFGPETFKVFPVGGRGACGSCLSLLFELFIVVYALCVPLYLVFLVEKSNDYGGIQMASNLIMWGLFLIQLLLLFYCHIALQIHRINTRRFLNCPWIMSCTSLNYILMGKPVAFREADYSDMIRVSKIKYLPEMQRNFTRNNPAMGMYYSKYFYKTNVSRISSQLLFYIFLLLVSMALYLFFGIKRGQIVLP